MQKWPSILNRFLAALILISACFCLPIQANPAVGGMDVPQVMATIQPAAFPLAANSDGPTLSASASLREVILQNSHQGAIKEIPPTCIRDQAVSVQ